MWNIRGQFTLSIILLVSCAMLSVGCGRDEALGILQALVDTSEGDGTTADAQSGVPCAVDEDCLDAFETLECEMAICTQPYGTCMLITKPPGTPCKDGVTCTGPDYCIDGECGGSPLKCDDEDPCTDDTCDEKLGCVHTPNTGALCDDGNPCSSGDTCDEGICKAGAEVEGCCQWDPQCNDGDPCTEDTCQINTCVYGFTQAPCDDKEPCTYQDYCDGAGACVGSPVPCDDANPCTIDACDPTTGACATSPEVDGAPCDDYNPCTTSDACQAGVCVGGGNTCQCTSDGDCAVIEDGNLCNGTLKCAGNTCVLDPNSVVTCNSAGDTACQKTTCDPATGQCVPTANPDGAPCDDQDACSEGDQCTGGICVGVALGCDDLNECTYDACSLADGCTHTPKSGACDDGDSCTTNDQCVNSACAGEPKCDDSNPCTDDYCDAVLGCASIALEGGCDDGDACTIGDTCIQGLCVPGQGLECNDGDSCTTDGCVAGSCTFVELELGSPCDDNDSCTEEDTCTATGCVGDPAILCDDGNSCTLDTCTDGECTTTPIADGTTCDASDLCIVTSTCQAGVCTAVETKPCDDGNECTQNLCADGVCEHPPVEDGTLCGNGEVCGSASCCHSGSCTTIEFPACPVAICGEAICSDDTGACTTAPVSGPCCGDGTSDPGELCDDGNAYLDDGCDTNCEPSDCAARSVLHGAGNGMLMYPSLLLTEFESATIEMWLKPADTGQDAVLFHRKESGGVDWFKMSYSAVGSGDGNARLTWKERIADGTVKTVMGPTLSEGVWQHVALVRRFSLSAGKVDWYINGVLQTGSEPYVGMIDIGSADLLYVACQAGYAKSFIGGIDELRISSVARYDTDFTPSAVPFTTDTDTIALHHFDDQLPGVGIDQSAGGFNLHWHGAQHSPSSPFSVTLGDDTTCQVDFCQPGGLTIPSSVNKSGTIAQPDDLDGSQSFTIEFFVKIPDNDSGVMISRGNTAEASWLLHHNST
ncbi:MAG: LamG-like jellyroll fold domain-containing protein, partial [Myxococcota bacterium]|nr:LamG-like jellyroll fold domain-containing protein [Myxococcota bacterium]